MQNFSLFVCSSAQCSPPQDATPNKVPQMAITPREKGACGRQTNAQALAKTPLFGGGATGCPLDGVSMKRHHVCNKSSFGGLNQAVTSGNSGIKPTLFRSCLLQTDERARIFRAKHCAFDAGAQHQIPGVWRRSRT